MPYKRTNELRECLFGFNRVQQQSQQQLKQQQATHEANRVPIKSIRITTATTTATFTEPASPLHHYYSQ